MAQTARYVSSSLRDGSEALAIQENTSDAASTTALESRPYRSTR